MEREVIIGIDYGLVFQVDAAGCVGDYLLYLFECSGGFLLVVDCPGATDHPGRKEEVVGLEYQRLHARLQARRK